MDIKDIVQIITPLLPTLVLIFGGQWILNRYEAARKAKEQEVELVRFVREQQYAAAERLYELFAEFMALYRENNSRSTDLTDETIRRELLRKAIEAEAEVDSLILRIGCEFEQDARTAVNLTDLLGNLRQSVQLWRETIEEGGRLPFHSSDSPDYARFKDAFAKTAAFMVHQIHARLEPPTMRMDEATQLLEGAFSNIHEHYGPRGG